MRLRAGVSQEKLAELAGLHRTYLSSVERGLRNISLINIGRLAQALNVSPADIMPGRPAGGAAPIPTKPERRASSPLEP